MRNLAIGCGTVALVVLLLGGGAAWWFLGRPIAAAATSLRDLQRIETTYLGVENQRAYEPPEDGVLEERQIDRWLAVQASMRSSLDDTVEQLRGRSERLEGLQGDPSPQQLVTLVRDAAGLVLDATRVQVDALNEVGFSLEEYRWVRDQVLWAAGHPLVGYDLTAIVTAAADDRSLAAPGGTIAPPPPINVERVAPYLDQIEEALVFAWFGL